MVDFFIKRPIFAIVCALLIILAGAICIPTLPISLYPNLAPPQVTVSSNYVGANAQVVESAVTIPLEQQINGVEGMHYITSTSSNDGTSSINVTFRTGYDLNIAAVDVQNRVATAQGRLPQEPFVFLWRNTSALMRSRKRIGAWKRTKPWARSLCSLEPPP